MQIAANSLDEAIQTLGDEMVACRRACSGTRCSLREGILPRGLVLVPDPSHIYTGCVIVGINPGRAGRVERVHFGPDELHSYDEVRAYWAKRHSRRHYYVRLKHLRDELGITGAILWTELAKCENACGVNRPPHATLQTCARTFLARELAAVPSHWPVIAAGRATFNALCYLAPERPIIGVWHPTGRFSRFKQLFANGDPEVGALWPQLYLRGVDLNTSPPKAVWLPELHASSTQKNDVGVQQGARRK